MEPAPVAISTQRSPRAQLPREASHDAFVTLLSSAPDKPPIPIHDIPAVVSKEKPELQLHIADPVSESALE
jgi:hypothetical protein